MAAAVWLRRAYFTSITNSTPLRRSTSPAGLEDARRGDEHPQVFPEKFRIERVTDRSLAELLGTGGIDALYTARAPSTWPSANVKRLFADPIAAELAYFHRDRHLPAHARDRC